MPTPKGAGKADPRFGRISSRVIDEIANDSERRKKLFRMIDRLQRRALKLAFAEGGLESFGPDGPMGPPPCAVAAAVAKQVMEAEKLKLDVLAREQEIDAKATALFMLLHGSDEQPGDQRPTEIVIKYAANVKPVQDGDPAQPTAEPDASGADPEK